MSALIEQALHNAYAANKVELDEYQEHIVREALTDAEILLRHSTRGDIHLDLGIAGRKAVTAGVANAALDYMRTIIRGEQQMAEQPDPTPTGGAHIHDLVREDLRARKHKGIETYGTPLQAHNGRDALWDAYEEALDLACYLRTAIEEKRTKAPNWPGFGEGGAI